MITSSTKVIAAIALVAALLGATIGGALVRSSRTPAQAETNAATTTTPSQSLTNDGTQTGTETTTTEQASLDTSATTPEEAAYRDGFDEGFRTARARTSEAATTRYASSGRSATRTRVVYRNGRSVASNGSRQAYYDYSEPRRGRTFWQKHRDKLTVAMGAGGGALIGGLIGGKRGAGIGALAGGGGSALYTYKLRNRQRRY
ncbi:MAG TPA: hypothetical protein VF708_04460 [Pyrinomonadaceae bacterium]